MLTFVYFRVSTYGQTIENQALEVERAGYQPDQVYAETVSGKTLAAERPEFGRLLDAIKRTTTRKRLIVTKLDRLGRSASDMLATVEQLSAYDCPVQVLQLGALDLTSAAGRMVCATLAGLAAFERELLVERTKAGLQRAKAAGVKMGRPYAATPETVAAIKRDLAKGLNLSATARKHHTSRGTVQRINKGEYAA